MYKYLQDEMYWSKLFYILGLETNKKKYYYEMIVFHFIRVFYGKNMKMAFNIWTPILGSATPKALAYVPNSHKIPDKEIKFYKTMDRFTKKSSGHKLGFYINQKKYHLGYLIKLDL